MGNNEAHIRLGKCIDLLRFNGIARTQREIAEKLDYARSNVSAAINGNPRYLTESFLKRFANAYADYINEDWLLTGKGTMEKSTRNLRPHYPAKVEAGVLAGDATTVMADEVEMEPVIARFPSYDYMIDISGQSMEPTYFDGDSVACRKLYNRSELKPGKVYVIATQDGAVIKRLVSSTLSSIRVSSDNPEYKSYNIAHDSIISIAEVVGSIHTNKQANDRIHEALLRYAQSILVSRINNATISKEKREEIIHLILNNQEP